MFDDPVFAVVYFCIAAYIFRLWVGDLRASPKPKNAFPGTEYAPWFSVAVAVAGIMLILAAYTFSELALGVESEQTELSAWALLSIIPAAFVEELIFRGWLVVENRGRAALVGSIVGFSVIFSLAHPYFWNWSSETGLVFNFTTKAAVDCLFIFLNSIWFYAVRFMPINPRRSLIPCIAAHLAYNIGVYAVKMVQGFA